MGIESDHLVYEYLSRVGDLAQQRQLSSGDRMRLVSGLRDEIDRRRARFEPETPEAVRAVLERLGTPEEVLDAVGRPTAAGAAAVPPVS
ncbi:membrane protein, partial [Streptomyces sp. RSD-27]